MSAACPLELALSASAVTLLFHHELQVCAGMAWLALPPWRFCLVRNIILGIWWLFLTTVKNYRICGHRDKELFNSCIDFFGTNYQLINSSFKSLSCPTVGHVFVSGLVSLSVMADRINSGTSTLLGLQKLIAADEPSVRSCTEPVLVI